MASATRTRDWAKFDYYAVLGIEPTADAEQVTRAFRELAKRSHPDVAADAAAAARFSDVTAAYGVLADRETRDAYDQVRAEQRTRAAEAAAAAPAPATVSAAVPRKPWSRRRAWTVLVSGVLVTLLGIGAALLTWSWFAHDAMQRRDYVLITADRNNVGGASWVSFLTKNGVRVRVPEPQQHGDPSALGPTVQIRYQPSDPQHVITDDSNMGRDITFLIVTLKLLVGGPVFTVMGWRRLRVART
jgi:DnaJ domain